MKDLIQNTSALETFSDELFFEIFNRLSPSDLYQAFYTLNIRFNRILNDSRMRFRDNISSLNPEQFKLYIKTILPQIIDRLTSFTFGTYDTDEVRLICLKTKYSFNMFFYNFSINKSVFFYMNILLI
jgi:hypothetical protein